MQDRRLILLLAASVALSLLGCNPEIGDSCSASLDCSDAGDRVCDGTLPGGYCTIINCEPDSCPSEAACIAFLQAPSTVPECADPGDLRTERTACMRRCHKDGDCRSGYDCIDLSEPGNPWSAALADRKRTDGRVCIVPYDAQPSSTVSGAHSDYCTADAYPNDPNYAMPSEAGAAGASGAAGAAGASGAAGAAGASGAAGAGGDSGASGASGAAGDSGSAGSAGESPAAGAAGTAGQSLEGGAGG